MESVKTRFDALTNAIYSLKEALVLLDGTKNETLYEALRDSVIKRFEYSLDTLWKFLKEYLEQKYGVKVETASPKSVFRASLNNKIITDDEFEILITMTDDRNLT